jgi:lysophospholipase L1-like esterase
VEFRQGINRATYDISATGGCTVTYTLTGTDFFLYYTKQPGGGKFDWFVDSEPLQTVDTSADEITGGQVITVLSGADPNSEHTLVFAWNSGGPVWIDGVQEFNGDLNSGIQVFNCGNPGSSTANWATQNWESIASLFSGLYVLCLGGEDIEIGVSPADMAANFNTIMDGLIAANAAVGGPVPSFVLFAAYKIVTGPNFDLWPEYVAAMYQVAAARTDTTVIDFSIRFPPDPADGGGIYADDGIHPSNIGHSLIGDTLANYLGPQ